jgi:ribosome-associated protein
MKFLFNSTTLCLALAAVMATHPLTSSSSSSSLAHAFQTSQQQHIIRIQPSKSSSSSTSIHLASRKGNRGPKRSISENTSKRIRPQVNDVLDGITSPPEFPNSVDPSDLPSGPISDDPLTPFVHTIVRAADMRKGSDIVALRVTQCSSLTNFVIIISGTSRPQNQAIANSIKNDVEELYNGKRCLGKGIPEGSADSGWILLDYGEVMVHVMTPKSRLFYDMEGQWVERGGEYLDLSDVLVDEIMMGGGVGGGGALGGVNDEDVEAEEEEEEEEEEEQTMRERLDVEKEIDPFWS